MYGIPIAAETRAVRFSSFFSFRHAPRPKVVEEIIDIMKVIKQIITVAAMLAVMTPCIYTTPLQKKDEKQQPKEPKVVVNPPKKGDPPRDKDNKDNKGENREGKKP